MKTFWSWLAKILLVVSIVEGWLIYDYYSKHQLLLVENGRLEEKLSQTELKLDTALAKVEALEKNSIEGKLKDTNQAIVDGWELLLERVEQELSKARESLPQLLNEDNEVLDDGRGSNKPQQPLMGETAEEGSATEEPKTKSESNESSFSPVVQGKRT